MWKLDIEDNINSSIFNFNNFSWEGILNNFSFFFKTLEVSGYNKLGS